MPLSLISLVRFVRGNIKRAPRTAMSPEIPIFISLDSPAWVLFRRSQPRVKARRVALTVTLSNSDRPGAATLARKKVVTGVAYPVGTTQYFFGPGSFPPFNQERR